MIRPILNVCATVFATMLLCTGVLNQQGPAYYLMSVAGVAVHLIWQLSTVDLENPMSCWREYQFFPLPARFGLNLLSTENFRKNSHLGWIVWSGLFLDYVRVISIRS